MHMTIYVCMHICECAYTHIYLIPLIQKTCISILTTPTVSNKATDMSTFHTLLTPNPRAHSALQNTLKLMNKLFSSQSTSSGGCKHNTNVISPLKDRGKAKTKQTLHPPF